jgi:hypothetical protein
MIDHFHITRTSGRIVTRTDIEGASGVSRATGGQAWLCRGGERCPESLTTELDVEHASGGHYQAFKPECSRCQGQSPNQL